jgi:undecaprenyl diphosphate synthase
VSAGPASGAEAAGGGGSGAAVPRHVAIIMDGNGRWAKARGLPRAAGHRQGAEAARKVLRAAGEAGVECLTLYAFSSENWRRPKTEVNDLMGLLRLYIGRELESLHKEGVRIKVLGDHRAFSPDTARMIDAAVARTAGNTRMTLAVALNYGSRAEIVNAARGLAARVMAGELAPDAIDEAAVEGGARHGRPAAARSPHPHVRRAAPVQFPALAGGLCRVPVRGHALAGLRRRRSARRARSICRPRAPLWRIMSETPPPAPGTAPKKNADLPTRFAAGVVMIAVAVVVTYISGWPFRVLAALAAGVMIAEWAAMHRVPRLWTWLAVGLVAATLIAFAEYLFPAAANNPVVIEPDDLEAAGTGFAAVAAAAVIVGLLSRRLAMGWGILYIGIPGFALVVLNWAWSELVLWLFFIVWATDIFAYFAGRSIGGPKLAPRISPNKTWAGLAGGIVGAAAVGGLAAWYMQLEPVFMFVGGPMALLAQLGDLYESSVKRRRGVKDSGTILPGHGGVLDRLDGLLPAALATYALLWALSLGYL